MSHKAAAWAMEETITETAVQKLVLMVLADCHNAESGDCWPSYQYLASRSRSSRRTVMRTISQLENLGLVVIQPRHKSTGDQASNQYVLQMRSTGSKTKSPAKGSDTLSPGVVTNATGGSDKVALGGGDRLSPGSDTVSLGVVTNATGGSDTVSPKPGINQEYEPGKEPRERARACAHAHPPDGAGEFVDELAPPPSKICPEDFRPDPWRWKTLQARHPDIDLEFELEKFKLHEFQYPRTQWTGAFAKWLHGAKPQAVKRDFDSQAKHLMDYFS